jgi:hypothetical protein
MLLINLLKLENRLQNILGNIKFNKLQVLVGNIIHQIIFMLGLDIVFLVMLGKLLIFIKCLNDFFMEILFKIE